MTREEDIVQRAIAAHHHGSERVFTIGKQRWRIREHPPEQLANRDLLVVELVKWRIQAGSYVNKWTHGKYEVVAWEKIAAITTEEVLGAISKVVARQVHDS